MFGSPPVLQSFAKLASVKDIAYVTVPCKLR